MYFNFPWMRARDLQYFELVFSSILFVASFLLARFASFPSFRCYLCSLAQREDATPTFFPKRNPIERARFRDPSVELLFSLSLSFEPELIEPTLTRAKSVPSSLHYYGSAPGPFFFPPPTTIASPLFIPFKGPWLVWPGLPILLHRSLSRWREVPDFCPIKKFNLEVSK